MVVIVHKTMKSGMPITLKSIVKCRGQPLQDESHK